MLGLRRIMVCFAMLVGIPALTACGSASSPAVVRVGDAPITQATLSRWIEAMARQHVAPSKRRQQALDKLISAQWLIGEAAAEGTPVTKAEVARRLAEKEHLFPGGKSEFEQFLQSIAQTVSDQELELSSELATAAIKRKLSNLIADEPKITQADVAHAYRSHLGEYFAPEQRTYYIVENIPSRAQARQLIAQVRAGKRSMKSVSIIESYPRLRTFFSYPYEKPAVMKAIFTAPLHVPTGPITAEGLSFLIEVFRITPGYQQSLAQVKSSIFSKLEVEQRQRTLANFIAAWHNRLKASTDCEPGYVVPRCRQYTGAEASEQPSFANISAR